MNKKNNKNDFDLIRAIKKFFLSAFVVITFLAYALHKPSGAANASLSLAAPTPTGVVPPEVLTPTAPADTPTAPNTAAAPNTGAPTTTAPATPALIFPTPTTPATAAAPNTSAQASGQYKDGTYTGPVVDAVYGMVQVQAVIQNGKISNVQFLEYPNDRRTSIRINNVAVPYLQQEAIQAQSANVDLITGATLTSQAFQMSLQSALSKAKGSL